MTAPSPDLPTAPAPPGPPVTPSSPRRRWPVVVAVVVAAALLIGLLGAIIRLPYVIYSPGDATPVEGIVKVSGARTYRSRGEVLFLTVSVSTERPNVWRWVQASLDSDSDVVGENSFLQGQSRSRVEKENVAAMTDSQSAAKKVALEQLGYTVTESGNGAIVVQVVKGSPASGHLEEGDVITAIDGAPIRLAEQVGTIVRARPVGTTFDFTVTRKGATRSEKVTTAAAKSGPLKGKPQVGIVPVTKDLKFDYPVDITIDPGPVSGPSAGLAFTLTIIDELTPGSLTGAQKVAVTGTMDLDGNVGEVGGVTQKTAAALDAGAKLFIVPKAEVKDARARAGSKATVIGVSTIDGALRALREHGGAPVPKTPAAAAA
ncbi:MAG TPA: PDZ domain-containing protein [Acidimicrobiia bacterium]